MSAHRLLPSALVPTDAVLVDGGWLEVTGTVHDVEAGTVKIVGKRPAGTDTAVTVPAADELWTILRGAAVPPV